MTEASLAVQKAIGDRLAAAAEVTAIVPAGDIADRGGRPARFPSITIGDAQALDAGLDLKRRHVIVAATLHLWLAEPGLARVKALAGAVKRALRPRFTTSDGYQIADLKVEGVRFLRDPDGQHSHGVVDVEALVKEPT
ncbi:hypothetical protein A6302_03850 [Methylobrevis pamukkalensis]|uniref:DUF3168 domain-containing protein n=2 Tax=Methylobrevis pamukkalensis TaxID=1439726 RepID=A0A1E3GY47_9HYPH|nr:hypothetical protein A6302_03850 [Methylobrevis pamukkalensis]